MIDVKLSLTENEAKSLIISIEEVINSLIGFLSIASYDELPEVFYSLFVLSKLYNAIDI